MGDVGDVGDIGSGIGDVGLGDISGSDIGSGLANPGTDVPGSDFSGMDPSVVESMDVPYGLADFNNNADLSNTDFGQMNFNTEADLPELTDLSILQSKQNPIAALLGMLGLPGNIVGAITGQNTSVNAAHGLGMGLGALAANGIPGLGIGMGLAGMLGNAVSAVPAMSSADVAQANADNSNPGNAAGGYMNWNGDMLGSALGGLANLYSYNQQNKTLNNQIGGLSGMYGQNSPYAQALGEQLARRDAAAGRRSQYGPRSVELQAQLAGLASRNAPSIFQAQQQQNAMRNAGLGQLLNFAKKSGMLDKAGSYLSGMFGGGDNGGGQQDMGLDYGSYGGNQNFGGQQYDPMSFPSYSGPGYDMPDLGGWGG